MKNPIRNVVVEYKNRRARKSGNALWGNLDLKSIAREVEEDAKATISAEQTASSIAHTDNKPAVVIHESTPQVEGSIDPKIHMSKIPETIAAKASTASPESKMPVAFEVTVSSAQTKKKINVPRRLKPVADRPLKAKSALKSIADNLDELAALEAENIALKRQLAEKLAAENQQLREMFVRIETQTKL